MATLSPVRAAFPILEGLPLLHRGKVRDTYDLGENRFLIVVSDGISIFDFVLNAMVPEKGYILAAMSHFWFSYFEKSAIRTHMIAAGVEIDQFLPGGLRGNIDLQRRAMVVHARKLPPVEFIARACLTGSVLAEYHEKGTVYGKQMPAGLHDGDRLYDVLFTPTNKAEDGHDMPLDEDEVRKLYPGATQLFLKAFVIAFHHAAQRGIILADGKGENDDEMIADEFGTPDSSRFWDARAWKESRKAKVPKAPPPFDKQFAREWGIGKGINKLEPKNPEHVRQVHTLAVPGDIVDVTRRLYRYIFWRLTGMTLERYSLEMMGIELEMPVRKVTILAGSESDLPLIAKAVAGFQDATGLKFASIDGNPKVNVISCHRNPAELELFASSWCNDLDAVVCVGGKAFALPGVLDALLYSKGKRVPVVGVGLGEIGESSGLAAVLSIEEIPGNTVAIDELNDRAYQGEAGLMRALIRAASGEFPPVTPRAAKYAIWNVDLSKHVTA